mgnify:FL=1
MLFCTRAWAQVPALARASEEAQVPVKPQKFVITDEECAYIRDTLGYVDYYCECLNHSLQFHYGLDTLIQGVNWWESTLSAVSAGFSAYWFSTSSVLMEGFISCAQDSATLSQRIGANRSYHADIQSLISRFGGGSVSQLGNMPLNVRTTQAEGHDGRLIVTPYDKGPHSTCEDPLPVYYNMPYVISDADNVYEMLPANPNTRGQFLRWVCERGDSAVVSVGRGSCDAEPFMQKTLRDSMHVWVLPYDTLLNAYRAKDTLYFHFHTSAKLAEAWFMRPIEYIKDTIENSYCLGSVQSINGLRYSSDTVFADTVYLRYDSLNYVRQLGVTEYQLHFTAPEVEYDTINCHADSLGFYYLGMRSQQINRFGDYEVYFRRSGQCDRDIRLHVEELLYPIEIVRDTTICEGRRVRIDGKNYTRDTVFSTSAWQGKQETITTYRIHFTPAQLQYDTIYCYYDSLGFDYRGQKVTAFGTQTFTFSDATYQTCAERVQLTTEQLWYQDTVQIDTTVCQGLPFSMQGATEVKNDTFEYRYQDLQTKFVAYYNISRAAPEAEYDSLLLHISRMPYDYYGHILDNYGDTTIILTEEDKCDRLVKLHVEEYVYPITYDSAYIDTTFCRGKHFVFRDSLYAESAQFVDTLWTTDYSVLYTFCNIVVVQPVAEFDTVRLLTSSLPLSYEGEQFAEFGDYTLQPVSEEGCERLVYLHFEEQQIVYETMHFDTTLCTGQILHIADTVVFTPATFMRVYWTEEKDTCTTCYFSIYYSDEPARYDTAQIYYSQLPYHYSEYPDGGKDIATFGDFAYTYEPTDECKQRFYFHLQQIWARDTIVSNDTLCAGNVEQHFERQEPANIRQTDSIHLYVFNVYVELPQEYFDTLTVYSDTLPLRWENLVLAEAGEYSASVSDAAGCVVIKHLLLLTQERPIDDALDMIAAEEETKKIILNGHIYILHRGTLYDARGNKINLVNKF